MVVLIKDGRNRFGMAGGGPIEEDAPLVPPRGDVKPPPAMEDLLKEMETQATAIIKDAKWNDFDKGNAKFKELTPDTQKTFKEYRKTADQFFSAALDAVDKDPNGLGAALVNSMEAYAKKAGKSSRQMTNENIALLKKVKVANPELAGEVDRNIGLLERQQALVDKFKAQGIGKPAAEISDTPQKERDALISGLMKKPEAPARGPVVAAPPAKADAPAKPPVAETPAKPEPTAEKEPSTPDEKLLAAAKKFVATRENLDAKTIGNDNERVKEIVDIAKKRAAEKPDWPIEKIADSLNKEVDALSKYRTALNANQSDKEVVNTRVKDAADNIIKGDYKDAWKSEARKKVQEDTAKEYKYRADKIQEIKQEAKQYAERLEKAGKLPGLSDIDKQKLAQKGIDPNTAEARIAKFAEMVERRAERDDGRGLDKRLEDLKTANKEMEEVARLKDQKEKAEAAIKENKDIDLGGGSKITKKEDKDTHLAGLNKLLDEKSKAALAHFASIASNIKEASYENKSPAAAGGVAKTGGPVMGPT